VADDWHWSDWITPSLVPAKADIGTANAGAGIAIGDDADPNHAVDAVRRDGAANQGGSLAPPDAAPYSYMSSRLPGDNFSNAFTTYASDRAGAILTSPPTSYASFNVGYSSGFWRERPELRQLPPEFLSLGADDYVKIDPSIFTWDGYVEFEPGVDTVAVRWDDIYVNVLANGGDGNDLGGSIGYAPGAPFPPVSGWSGSFGDWPPPLGTKVIDLPAGPGSASFDAPLPVTPPPGSDWTITAYTDLAVDAYPVNDNWQYWEIRPYSASGQALYIWYQMPRFRYRIPEPALSPRFFVKHWDDTMRPAGFGKPATEQTLFRVAVQGGWYRDLTTDEYALYPPGMRPPGGYPLSVKRMTDAGEPWWDQVAWLVPE
jgi:hypothetical protein